MSSIDFYHRVHIDKSIKRRNPCIHVSGSNVENAIVVPTKGRPPQVQIDWGLLSKLRYCFYYSEKNLEISFEQDMRVIAASRENKCVIPVPALSGRISLVGGTALGASLLLGLMAEAERFAAAAQAGDASGKTQTLTARTFSSSRHTTRYWEDGPADGPLMIFLHGWPEIGLMWRAQVEAFASEGWHCVVPDMRGYGGSSVPTAAEAYALKEIVEDMVELHDHLGARPAIWVGHDWGSPVAGALAAHHAKRSRGIVLISVPYFANGFGLPSVLPFAGYAVPIKARCD
jgi:hypothetical protein